jgi:predicted nucleotidyltransferase
MTKSYIIKTLHELKPILKRKYKIKKIGLFGSYSINKQTKNSDIDIFVEFKEKSFDNVVGLWNFLEVKFNKKIDLIYKHKNSNKQIIENIQKRVIYG